MNIKANNVYQYLKTIRFKVEPQSCNPQDKKLIPPKSMDSKYPYKVKDITDSLDNIFQQFKMLFFYDKNTEFNAENKTYSNIQLTNKLEIKYEFLKQYTKQEFYEFKKENKAKGKNEQNKKYVLSNIEYLHDRLKETINECMAISERLKKLNEQPLESQRRRREFAQLLRQLKKRTNLEFLNEFVKAIHNNNKAEIENYDKKIFVDETLEELQKSFKCTREKIKEALWSCAPAQNMGIELLRATFNYYTLNKTPKEYDDEIKKNAKALRGTLDEQLFNKHDASSFKEIGFDKKPDWELKTIYCEAKKWKAERKSKFMERMNSLEDMEDLTDATIQDIQSKHPLFQVEDTEELKIFLKRTLEIKHLATIKNKLKEQHPLSDKENEILNRHKLEKNVDIIQTKITEIKKQRGSFFNFNVKYSKTITKQYYKFCEWFKKIAMERGKCLAKIKSLEYEKQDALLLTHLAFILKENKQHKLVLVPREENDLSELQKKFNNYGECEETAPHILYSLRSLTLSALEKLCFKEYNNTFKKKIIKDTKNKIDYPRYKRKLYQNCNEAEGDKKLIRFYQEVLNTDHAKQEVSKYDGIDDIISKDYSKSDKPMDAFRKDLERCCYVKRQKPAQDVRAILKDRYKASVLAIDCLDFRTERNHKNTIEERERQGKNTDIMRKTHDETTQNKPTLLWKEFWTEENKNNNYRTRLNPEIKLFWREPRESRVKKYGQQPNNFDPTKKNRFLFPQYTLSTTFTLNTGEKDLAFAWDSSEKMHEKIKEFNKLYKKQLSGTYLYGIDRGLNQLATLCVVKDKDNTNDKPKEFPVITTYTLEKDKYYYTQEIADKTNIEPCDIGKYDKGFGGPIKNISLFADKFEDEKWFEKKESHENACLDLTTAKIIKGKIITNGDLQTHLNLKKIAAERKIYDLFHKGKITKDDKITGTKTLHISGKNEQNDEFTIYWLDELQKSEFEKRGKPVLDNLNAYLKELINNTDKGIQEGPPIEKINHLRDAITANMVGVIHHLHKTFPAKVIRLENLDEMQEKENKKFIEVHREQSNQHISRRLEWSLYRKFQQEGLVPPNIKETLLLKDEYKETQFGVIEFINTKGTSACCPNCGKDYDNKDELKNQLNPKNSCEKCGFNSGNQQGLALLNDYDKMAAYNIACQVNSQEKN